MDIVFQPNGNFDEVYLYVCTRRMRMYLGFILMPRCRKS